MKIKYWSIWVGVGIRRNRRRNAHCTRAFVQCAEMQMSSLQHGEGCDCAAVKSCPGCQSWIIPRKGKASISRRGGVGRGGGDFIMARHADLARSSTHQGNRGRHPASQMNGFIWLFKEEQTQSLEDQANTLCLADNDFHSRVAIARLWRHVVCLFVCSFCYLTILRWCFFRFACFFLFGNFYILSWSEVTLLTWPLSGDPPVTVPQDDLPTLPFSNVIVLHQDYSSKILHDCPSLGRETMIMHYCTSPASRVLA